MSTAFQILAGVAILVLATLHGLARLIEAVSGASKSQGKLQVDDDKTVVINDSAGVRIVEQLQRRDGDDR